MHSGKWYNRQYAVKHIEEYEPSLKGVNLKALFIKNMDDPGHMKNIDNVLKYHEYLARVLPLHQRQVYTSDQVYSNRCKNN